MFGKLSKKGGSVPAGLSGHSKRNYQSLDEGDNGMDEESPKDSTRSIRSIIGTSTRNTRSGNNENGRSPFLSRVRINRRPSLTNDASPRIIDPNETLKKYPSTDGFESNSSSGGFTLGNNNNNAAVDQNQPWSSEDARGPSRKGTRDRQPHTPKLSDFKKPKPAPVQPTIKHPLILAITKALEEKQHMMDITLTGRDGARVKASRFVLACRFASLQITQDDELNLGDYSEVVIRALVEFCFAGEIVRSPLKQDETEGAARGLVELAKLGASLKAPSVVGEAYQGVRRLINRHPSLACAVYDEANTAPVREFETYALQIMEESPREAFLEKSSCAFLSGTRLKDLMLNHDNLDELEDIVLFRILARWVEQKKRTEQAKAIAGRCAARINFELLNRIEILTTVKQSGFVDMTTIEKALKEKKRKKGWRTDVERVMVVGAGLDLINGMYYRENDADGEIIYQKQDAQGDLSLHRWGATWGITPAHDMSNQYYTCETGADKKDQVPSAGWQVEPSGTGPAPTCHWYAATSSEEGKESSDRKNNLPACFGTEEELYGN